MALEMLEFIDSRLFASRVPWNGPVPEYQVLVADVSMPSIAFAHRETSARGRAPFLTKEVLVDQSLVAQRW